MIYSLKPYHEYKESGFSMLSHLRKSVQSVDDFSQDYLRASAESALSETVLTRRGKSHILV
jgi:hypothetical protein